MKSYGQLWSRIVSEENLWAAWERVRRGHSNSLAVVEYEKHINENLSALQNKLMAGIYQPSGYRQFRICDPKPRTISCAPVVDRIVHHAICGVVTPLFEKRFVSVSFACRKGYGTHAACLLARKYVGRAKYFCKMDIRRYFDNIDHEKLLGVILPMFREIKVKELIRKIVEYPVPGQKVGMGLPIGNLTSQWFANVFLDAFDHAALMGFGIRKPAGFIRYMDDFVFFTETKSEAWRLHDEAKLWLAEKRGLSIKDEATVVAPVSEGVPFLGLRIWGNSWRLKRARFLRTRRTYAKRIKQFENGVIDESRMFSCTVSSDGAARWFGFKGILNNVASKEGSSSGSNRVKRGGSWNNNANNCTSSNRNNNNPSNENNNNGFRLVSTVSEQTGFHFDLPESHKNGNEHAKIRTASSESDRRFGISLTEGK